MSKVDRVPCKCQWNVQNISIFWFRTICKCWWNIIKKFSSLTSILDQKWMSDILGTLWHPNWTSWTFIFKSDIQKSKKMNVRHPVWFLELNVHKWNWMSISKLNVRHFWMSISKMDVTDIHFCNPGQCPFLDSNVGEYTMQSQCQTLRLSRSLNGTSRSHGMPHDITTGGIFILSKHKCTTVCVLQGRLLVVLLLLIWQGKRADAHPQWRPHPVTSWKKN